MVYKKEPLEHSSEYVALKETLKKFKQGVTDYSDSAYGSDLRFNGDYIETDENSPIEHHKYNACKYVEQFMARIATSKEVDDEHKKLALAAFMQPLQELQEYGEISQDTLKRSYDRIHESLWTDKGLSALAGAAIGFLAMIGIALTLTVIAAATGGLGVVPILAAVGFNLAANVGLLGIPATLSGAAVGLMVTDPEKKAKKIFTESKFFTSADAIGKATVKARVDPLADEDDPLADDDENDDKNTFT